MIEIVADVVCPDCGHGFEVNETDCPSLRDAVEEAIDDAVDDAKDEVRSEYELMSDPEPEIDVLMLGDLACAIRTGETAEAELLLDRIAAMIGSRAQHEVEIGRYRRHPQLAKVA